MSNPIEINTPIVGIETSIFKDNNVSEFSLYITSNIPFSHNNIPYDIINIFIALDISGSMNVDVPNINNNINSYSRLQCCIQSINTLIEFLKKLVSSNKNINLWIYSFNSITTPIIENYSIHNNKETTNFINNQLSNLYGRYNTDIGTVIERIDREKSYLRTDNNSNTISILLSDGFTNSGLSSIDIKNTYSKFFDATIGIGEDADYDFDLLTALSKESRVRGCMTSDDIYDQIIDAVFNSFEVYMNSLKISIPNDIKLINSNIKYTTDSHSSIYFSKLRHSQPIILIFTGDPHSITFEMRGVKIDSNISKINKRIYDNNDDNSLLELFLENVGQNDYILDICLNEDGIDYIDNNLTINIGNYLLIRKFINIINEFNTFDINDISSTKVIKENIDLLSTNLNISNDIRSIKTMKTIIDIFKRRIDILYENRLIEQNDLLIHEQQPNLNYRYNNTSNNNSPLSPSQSVTSVNIIRRQAGNYSSLASNLSQEYTYN